MTRVNTLSSYCRVFGLRVHLEYNSEYYLLAMAYGLAR
uniref:Uncharacterized protein n=1 Tax=Lepeophtheirus salmonis TaxID=72036 RepID=A0A0K2VL67_LEPSM